MRRNRLKILKDLELIRAMCANSGLLTSECEAAPVIVRNPKAEPDRNCDRPAKPQGERERDAERNPA